MNKSSSLIRLTAMMLAFAGPAIGLRSAEVDPGMQAKIDAKVAEIKVWAADPAIVAAVAAHNAQLPAEAATMTQERWKKLSVLDPFVRSFSKNEAGSALKAHKTDWVSEAFISDAKGLKVGFLSKPSAWSHAGNPKHDVPMSGKVWQGEIAVDESAGVQELQVAVAITKDGQPIGSLVVGLSLGKL
jgi:hypothetical protein